jgi:hypothetical protein
MITTIMAKEEDDFDAELNRSLFHALKLFESTFQSLETFLFGWLFFATNRFRLVAYLQILLAFVGGILVWSAVLVKSVYDDRCCYPEQWPAGTFELFGSCSDSTSIISNSFDHIPCEYSSPPKFWILLMTGISCFVLSIFLGVLFGAILLHRAHEAFRKSTLAQVVDICIYKDLFIDPVWVVCMPLKNLLFSRSLFALNAHTWIPRARQIILCITAILIVTLVHIQWFYEAYCCYPPWVEWQHIDDKTNGICNTPAAFVRGMQYPCEKHPFSWFAVLVTIILLLFIDLMLFVITLRVITTTTDVNLKDGFRHDKKHEKLQHLIGQCTV